MNDWEQGLYYELRAIAEVLQQIREELRTLNRNYEAVKGIVKGKK